MKRSTHAVVKGDRVDDHKSIEIIFVRYVIAMPCDYVEGTVTLISRKQLSLIFAYDLVIDLAILVPSHRRLKVSRTRQAVRSYALAPLINSLVKETLIYRVLDQRNLILQQCDREKNRVSYFSRSSISRK